MRPSVHVVSDKQVSWVFRKDMSLLRLTFGSIVKLYSTMKFKAINGVKPSNAGLIWLLKFQLACSSLDSSLKGKLPQPRSSSLSTGSSISLPLLYLSPTCFATSLSNKDLRSDLCLPADPLYFSAVQMIEPFLYPLPAQRCFLHAEYWICSFLPPRAVYCWWWLCKLFCKFKQILLYSKGSCDPED